MSGAATVTYLPWLRRRLGATLGVEPGGGSRPKLDVTLRVSGRSPGGQVSHRDIQKELRLYGPGDVIGIDPRQLIRTDPTPYATDHEPTRLAVVEFHEHDLPWLFSIDGAPAPGAPARVRPWIALVVLDRDRAQLDASRRPLPVVKIDDSADQLPDLSDAWAWAHAQVARSLGEALESRPELTLSRLLCPRRLEAGRAYLGCVVPAFKAGVQAGLGSDQVDDTRDPAWASPASGPIELPVYFSWEFGTGPQGDFRSLASRLRPRRLPERVGRRALGMGSAAASLGLELPDHPLEGALRPVTTAAPAAPPEPPEWPDAVKQAFRDAVTKLLERRPGAAQLAVPPPIYGDRHAGSPGKLPTGAKPWVTGLNLDPRYRVAAGLGARVVQERQEQLVASAWDQAGAIERANQALRQAQLAEAAGERVFEERLAGLPDEALLQVTDPVHARVPGPDGTLRTRVRHSAFPEAAASAPFRRALRPAGPLGRRLGDGSAQLRPGSPVAALLERLARGQVPRLLTPAPEGSVSLDAANAEAKRRDPGKYAKLRGYEGATEPAIAQRSGWRRVAHFRGELSLESVRPNAAAAPIGDSPEARTAARPWKDVDPSPIDEAEIDETEVELQERLKRMRRRFHLASEAHQRLLLSALSPPVDRGPELPLSNVAGELVGADGAGKLTPRRTIADRVEARVGVVMPGVRRSATGSRLAPLAPVPKFDQPMYEALREISQDLLLPGIEQMPADSVGLMEGNPPFVEAYMVGLNHAMARELEWRGFATDPSATFFRQFWNVRARVPGDTADPPEDIPPIAGWQSTLGRHASGIGSGGVVVLAFRGELVRRYANLILYAAEAESAAALKQGGATRHPSFRAALEPDVLIAGFDLTVGQARGSATHPGWFFVLAEQPTEPRFGFDGPAAGPPPGDDSAQVAKATLQPPVRVAIHAQAMLDPIVGPSPDEELGR